SGQLLARLGVDGIVVAKELDFDPEPANQWQLVASTDEGRVFHRSGPALSRVRSVLSLPSQPEAHFAAAKISDIHESRNEVEADVEVPNGTASALITFSRPCFEGYQASLGGRKLEVASEHSLYPMVELPAGSGGRLLLKYQPAWLLYGSSLALGCAAIFLGASLIGLWNGDRRPTLPNE